MTAFEYVIVAFGGNAVLLAILAYLAKTLISQYLTKDLEGFKTSLSQASSNAADEMKHRLSLTAHEHNVRFTRLHEKQAQVLEEIHSKLLDFEDASAALTLASESTPDELKESALRRAEDAGRQLDQYIRRNEIYIPVATSDNLAQLMKQIFTLLGNCSFSLLATKLMNSGSPVQLPEAKEAWSQVNDYLALQAPAVRKSVEIEFRKMLGTE
jgi:hypothetical protein